MHFFSYQNLWIFAKKRPEIEISPKKVRPTPHLHVKWNRDYKLSFFFLLSLEEEKKKKKICKKSVRVKRIIWASVCEDIESPKKKSWGSRQSLNPMVRANIFTYSAEAKRDRVLFVWFAFYCANRCFWRVKLGKVLGLFFVTKFSSEQKIEEDSAIYRWHHGARDCASCGHGNEKNWIFLLVKNLILWWFDEWWSA